MRRNVILATSLCLIANAWGADTPQEEVRTAAKSVYAAVEAGDGTALRSAIRVDAKTPAELVRAQVDLILSTKRLADLAREKLGDAGREFTRGTLSPGDEATLDKAEVTVDGEHATVMPAGQTMPMTFQKVAGQWKLVAEYKGGLEQGMPQQIELIETLAAGFNETCEDFRAGRIKTADDLRASIQQKINNSLLNAAKMTTRPTTQSAK